MSKCLFKNAIGLIYDQAENKLKFTACVCQTRYNFSTLEDTLFYKRKILSNLEKEKLYYCLNGLCQGLSKEEKADTAPAFISYISIHLTSRCQLNCKYCCSTSVDYVPLQKTIINQLFEALSACVEMNENRNSILRLGFEDGEFYYNKELQDLAKSIKETFKDKIKINILTNFIDYDPETAPYADLVNGTLHFFQAEHIRNESFNNSPEEAIEKIIKNLGKLDLSKATQINLPMNYSNYNNLDDYLEFIDKHVVKDLDVRKNFVMKILLLNIDSKHYIPSIDIGVLKTFKEKLIAVGFEKAIICGI